VILREVDHKSILIILSVQEGGVLLGADVLDLAVESNVELFHKNSPPFLI
jgi:hypothetical protein